MAGKKISDIKIHLGVDILGLPNGIHVTTANVTDRDGALEMLKINAPKLSKILKVLCDDGYTGEPFANAIKALLDAAGEVAKRNELHKFAVIPKRWIVERSFSWLDNFRRLWKNCKRKLHNTRQLVTLAFISVLLNQRTLYDDVQLYFNDPELLLKCAYIKTIEKPAVALKSENIGKRTIFHGSLKKRTGLGLSQLP